MIKDSGTRQQFSTGAVRDIQKGKGRCDLLPLDVISKYMNVYGGEKSVFMLLQKFQDTGEPGELFMVLERFNEQHCRDSITMILEVSMHFEEGAEKYGEDNWKKGLPVKCYINSAVRHYLKFLRGDSDEPHDRAFFWNILCAIWTCYHRPELNDYDRTVCHGPIVPGFDHGPVSADFDPDSMMGEYEEENE